MDVEERIRRLREEGRGQDEVARIGAQPAPRNPSPAPGLPWGASGRYIIERSLGAGATGAVYAATDTLLDRLVALKILNHGPGIDEEENRARVLREARFAARVEHQRIARVYDVGEHQGSLFVAMEFVGGATLRVWMTGRDVAAREVVTIALQVPEGLAQL